MSDSLERWVWENRGSILKALGFRPWNVRTKTFTIVPGGLIAINLGRLVRNLGQKTWNKIRPGAHGFETCSAHTKIASLTFGIGSCVTVSTIIIAILADALIHRHQFEVRREAEHLSLGRLGPRMLKALQVYIALWNKPSKMFPFIPLVLAVASVWMAGMVSIYPGLGLLDLLGPCAYGVWPVSLAYHTPSTMSTLLMPEQISHVLVASGIEHPERFRVAQPQDIPVLPLSLPSSCSETGRCMLDEAWTPGTPTPERGYLRAPTDGPEILSFF